MKHIAIVLLAFSVIGTGNANTNDALASSERISGIQNTIKSAATPAPQPRKLLWPFYHPYMMSSAYAHMMINPMLSMMYMNPMMSTMYMNPMMYGMMGMNPMMYGMMGMYNPWLWGMNQNQSGNNNNGNKTSRKLFLNTAAEQKTNSVETPSQNHLTVPSEGLQDAKVGPISL